MNIPKLITRKRTKGFKLPPNTLCITRPGKWGNPFDTAAEFKIWLFNERRLGTTVRVIDYIRLTRKFDWMREHILDLCQYDYIACWCKEEDRDRCHGSVLLRHLETKLKNK